MSWTVEVMPRALKALKKMDKPTARVIRDELREIEGLDDPRSRGKALTGNLRGLWRYRVGDYRVICDILDDELVVLAIEIAHRSEVYRRQ